VLGTVALIDQPELQKRKKSHKARDTSGETSNNISISLSGEMLSRVRESKFCARHCSTGFSGDLIKREDIKGRSSLVSSDSLALAPRPKARPKCLGRVFFASGCPLVSCQPNGSLMFMV